MDEEDEKFSEWLAKTVIAASRSAVAKLKAQGKPVTYQCENLIVREHPCGL